MAAAEADAQFAGLRFPCLDPRRCHRAKTGISGRHHRRPDAFQPVRAVVRTDLGQRVVRDRMPVGALPQSGVRRRGSAGQHRAAEARSKHLRDRNDAARRHRDFARHGFGGRRWIADGIVAAAEGAKAAHRPRHPQGHHARHEDGAADHQDGCRSEHGRSLSVFAKRQAESDHRAVAVLFRRRQSLGPRDRAVRDAERAVSISRARGSPAGARTGCRPVRGSGNPPAARAAVRRRELHDGARGGRAQRQPPDREHVGAHDGVWRRRRAGGDDAAESREHQAVVCTV